MQLGCSHLSEIVRSVIDNAILVGGDKSIPTSLTLFTLLQSILNDSSFHNVAYSDLGHSGLVSGIFWNDNYHIQLSEKRKDNDNIDYYELIIAKN